VSNGEIYNRKLAGAKEKDKKVNIAVFFYPLSFI